MLQQQLVNGIILGAVYTLTALSYSFVMGILGILNISVSEIFMLGAYAGFAVLLAAHSVGMALAAGVLTAVGISLVVERVGVRPFRDAPVIMPLLSTVGFSIILQNVALNVWGSDPLQLPISASAPAFRVGALTISAAQVVILGAAVALVVVLAFVVQKTWLGRGLRAVAENREVASLLGVPASRITTAAFAISGVLAGAAGVLVGLHYSAITPFIGVDVGLKGIAVMVVGGTGRIWGILIAGPLMGVAEVLTVAYGGSLYRDMVVYGLLILALLLRPQGILGGSRSMERRV